MYCRTPLEPAPRGKRRKLDDSAYPQSSFSKVAELPTTNETTASAEKPAAAEEKIEKMEDVQKDKPSSSPEIKQETQPEAAAVVQS